MIFIIPASWEEVESPIPFTKCFIKFNRLMVLVNEGKFDNELWRHVSLSYPNKIPKWKDLREVKDIFIGKDKKAIQVFPKESEYVNIHPYVLHLWANLERDPLPDFTMGSGMI